MSDGGDASVPAHRPRHARPYETKEDRRGEEDEGEAKMESWHCLVFYFFGSAMYNAEYETKWHISNQTWQ
jgi:hypothetical protein